MLNSLLSGEDQLSYSTKVHLVMIYAQHVLISVNNIRPFVLIPFNAKIKKILLISLEFQAH